METLNEKKKPGSIVFYLFLGTLAAGFLAGIIFILYSMFAR